MKALKTVFKGLIYVLLSPFIIAGFALYTVYAVFLYMYELVIATVKFFSGSKLTTELKEDKKVKQIIIEKDKKAAEEKERQDRIAEKILNTPSQPQQTTTTINNFYISKDQLPLKNAAEPQRLPYEEVKTIENKQYIEAKAEEGGNDNDE